VIKLKQEVVQGTCRADCLLSRGSCGSRGLGTGSARCEECVGQMLKRPMRADTENLKLRLLALDWSELLTVGHDTTRTCSTHAPPDNEISKWSWVGSLQ
jgi:hypothetical protein